MTRYLENPGQLLRTSSGLLPPEAEIQAAFQILSQSPVTGYVPFTDEQVRVLGAYREFHSPRAVLLRVDDVWDAIVQGEWYAWIVAIHEITEIAEFERIGVNLWDRVQFQQHFAIAHLEALVAELQFLRAWAKDLGGEVPELALMLEHPIRRGTIGFRQDVRNVQQREGWNDPTPEELAAAVRFWAKRGRP